MIDRSVIQDVLYAALSTGGDFSEVFVESSNKNTLTMVNGKVEKVLSGVDYGVGIRIFDGNNAIYAYTNDSSKENLIKVAKEAAQAIKSSYKNLSINLLKKEYENKHVIKMNPKNAKKTEIVERLRSAHQSAVQYDSLISQVKINYIDTVQNVLIANSEGVWAEDERIRSRVSISSVASSETEKQTGLLGPGAHVGFELFDKVDMNEIAREASRSAVTMLKADYCPSGKMPVVIDNGFGGVIFHEACGHGLEATFVAKKASVFSDKLGEKIASDVTTAIDDGTIPNAWGSSNVDDEGTPTRKNVLIKDGVLTSYMIDKLNGRIMGMPSTGSARRQSYQFAPTSRMTNTYIASGDSKPEDIIANTEYGLYAKYMGGGSVNPSTGEFNFAVREGYLIRNGKIAEPVRGATLIGKGAEVLQKIDLVGNNERQDQGMCGSISGSIPANVGQPMIRVSELTVGGRKEGK